MDPEQYRSRDRRSAQGEDTTGDIGFCIGRHADSISIATCMDMAKMWSMLREWVKNVYNTPNGT